MFCHRAVSPTSSTGDNHDEPQLHDQVKTEPKEGPPEPQERGRSAPRPQDQEVKDATSTSQESDWDIMIAITHRIIRGNAYEGKTQYLYSFDKIDLDIYLANTATSITRKDTADLSDPNCRLHYVAAIADKAFYDHARFYAGADYDSAAWQTLKYCDHDIYLVKECEGDGEVYAVASSRLVPFIVIGKLVRDCVIRLKFENAVSRFKV